MEKIIDFVKSSVNFLKSHNCEPAKLQMDAATFMMMLEEIDDREDVVCIDQKDGRITYHICGLEFEERNDISKETMFIVS